MAAKNDWSRYDWGRVRHSFFKVIPLTLLAGGIVLGIRYVVGTYLAWRVPSFIYLAFMVIALLVVRSRARYTPPAKMDDSEKYDPE